MYSYVILFGFIAKSHYCGEDTAYFPYHTISKLSACHVSEGQSHQRLVFEHGSFHLDFVTLQMFLYAWFCSGRFLTLTLRTHTITTLHTTQSHNSPVSTLTLTLRTHTISTLHTTQSHNPCQYAYTNITYSHYNHTPHHIISQFPCQYPYTITT